MQQDPTQMIPLLVIMLGVYFFIFLVAVVAVIIPTWFICKKAGFSPWLSLLNIIPIGGLVLLYVLAFAEWKVVPVPEPAYWPPQTPPLPPQS
jgi:hypothetical protein